jgi:tetratricopeptide (TPR) repeat protein
MLSSFGAQKIDTSSTSEDAITKCTYDSYDVILCDFNLGQGKNGQQILEELRIKKRLKHIHTFIMITAETAKDVVLGTREYQPDGYIAKPITRTVLEQRLGHILTQQKILRPINREIDLENYTKAISLCQQELEDNTKYKSWCFQTLAKLYSLLGDTSNATKIYSDVLASREIPWAKLGIAQILNQEQHYEEAKDCLIEVIQKNPNMIEAYDSLSESYLKLGQKTEAQIALQEAADLSPRMIPRQEKLGSICLNNQDIEAASNAFRHAVQYAVNSVHEKPGHYLDLGRCLSDLSEGDTSESGKNRANEAVRILDIASDKFSNDEDASLSAALIAARVLSGQGNHHAADEKLHQAECMIEEENISPLVGLELAKTLYSMKQPERCESLLISLSEKFADDPNITSKIQSLLDEPEDLKARKQAKELNKSGITLFEQGKLSEAIESFNAACLLTPKHAALNLNIVQVIVKQYKKSPDNKILIEAQSSLERIKHIPEQHNQFKRLKHLQDVINKLIKKTEVTSDHE